MIKLDGYYYAVRMDGHTEVSTRPVRVVTTLAGKTLSVTGVGQPRRWQLTLLVDDESRTGIRSGYGDRAKLMTSQAKRTPPDNELSFYDERTNKEGSETCKVIILTPELTFTPLSQVLTQTKYDVEVELVEVLT